MTPFSNPLFSIVKYRVLILENYTKYSIVLVARAYACAREAGRVMNKGGAK